MNVTHLYVVRLLYPSSLKKVSRWNNSTDVKLLIGPGTLMCTIYNHLKFVSSSCTYHYNVNSRKCFSPIVKTCYQSGNVYLLKSTPLHLWFCFFQVSYPAHHEQIILVKRDLPTFVNKLGNKLFFLITIKFYHM